MRSLRCSPSHPGLSIGTGWPEAVVCSFSGCWRKWPWTVLRSMTADFPASVPLVTKIHPCIFFRELYGFRPDVGLCGLVNFVCGVRKGSAFTPFGRYPESQPLWVKRLAPRIGLSSVLAASQLTGSMRVYFWICSVDPYA